jgi:ERCC4-type nuclease
MPKTRRRTLITSPLEWRLTAAPVPAPPIPVLAERGGTQINAPKAVLLVDTREQSPLDCARFAGWFAGIEKRALALGDYSIAGFEDECVVERKDLPDLVRSFTTDRAVFISRLERMATRRYRLLLITAALSQVKSEYSFSAVDPNRIMQSLIAVLAGVGVPFLCTETHEMAEEVVASYLYQIHLYHWLDTNEFGRFLADGDL